MPAWSLIGRIRTFGNRGWKPRGRAVYDAPVLRAGDSNSWVPVIKGVCILIEPLEVIFYGSSVVPRPCVG